MTDPSKKPNITTSATDRASLAGAAIDKGVAMLNTAGQFDGWSFYYRPPSVRV
jgi:hypothetical protein